MFLYAPKFGIDRQFTCLDNMGGFMDSNIYSIPYIKSMQNRNKMLEMAE